MSLLTRFLSLCLSTLLVSTGVAQSMFGHNPARTGEAPGSGPKVLTSPKWTFKTGGWVIGSAVVDRDTVYVGSDDRNIYALDRATGAERWRFATKGHVRSTPAVAGSMVYAGSYDGAFYALDTATGKPRWVFQTGGERRFEARGLHGQKPASQTIPDFWDFYLSSPLVSDGIVYFGSGDGHVYALAADTGALVWRFKTGNVVHASPALSDGVLYIGSWDAHLYALDAKTGAERWRFKTGEDPENHNQTGIQSSPAVKDGVVYFGCRDANLYAVDAATGEKRWAFSIKPTWINATPAIHNGVAYVGSSIPHKFYTVDLATGKARFEQETDMIVFSSAAIADGVAYVGTFAGTLSAIDASTGAVLSQYQTEARKQDPLGFFGSDGKPNWGVLGGSEFFEDGFRMGANLLKVGSFLASPTLADGELYIGSADGNVYAFD